MLRSCRSFCANKNCPGRIELPSGFAPSGRYALPNPAAARGGTVRPAHHQSGGGVEIKFVNGAPAGSVFKSYRIPEI